MDYNITYRDKDGSIQAIVSYKKNGKWKQKAKQGFKKKKLAKTWADGVIDDLKENLEADLSQDPEENKGMTFKKFTEKLLVDIARYREENTVLAYKQTIGKFKKLNDIPMEDIEFMDIQECVNDMIDNKKLEVQTIKKHIAKIKTIFRKATKRPYKIIAATPIDDEFELPEDKSNPKGKALSLAEKNDLLKKLKDYNENYYMISLIAVSCGLREGEIIGLIDSRDVIDTKNMEIHVKRQWKLTEKGYALGTIKRKKSYRSTPLPINTLNELNKYKKNHKIRDVHNRIFLYTDLRGLSQNLSRVYRKLGYDITLHDLRHTYATQLLANGLDYDTVAEYLGHNVKETIRTYAHVVKEMRSKGKKIVNKLF